MLLLLAMPAQANKFKPGKATDAELLEVLARDQAEAQLAVLNELDKRALPTACAALAERNNLDDNAAVRGRSLEVMGTLACPNLLDTAVLAVAQDKFPANRLTALDVIAAHGSAGQLPVLSAVLQDDAAVQVRHRAVALAIDSGWDGAYALLETALRDAYTPIVQDAAVVLLAADTTTARQALYEEIPTLRALERETVMAVWQTHPMANDKGYLLATLDDSHAPVAVSAAVALGVLGDASVLPVLAQKLERERDKDVKKALKTAIKTLEK
jgi:hypothetical protein